jgi:mRNA interferase HigB
VIPRKRLNDFAALHPDSGSSLEHSYREVKSRRFANFVDLRTSFPFADHIASKTVSTVVATNAALLRRSINSNRLYIRAILPHSDYEKGKLKTQ